MYLQTKIISNGIFYHTRIVFKYVNKMKVLYQKTGRSEVYVKHFETNLKFRPRSKSFFKYV